MAIMTWARTPLLLVLLAAGGLTGCASGSGGASTDDSTDGTAAPTAAAAGSGTAATPGDAGSTTTTVGAGAVTDQAGEARSSNAELASVEFVAAALAGQGAEEFLASFPVDDPQRGAPYDPAALTARLGDLASQAAAAVSPSTTAYPDGALGPACDESAGLVCQVELAGADGRVTTRVVVHWQEDGVTDFVIVALDAAGAPNGIGQVRCSAGYTLIHGGHAVDRFDIAICVDGNGNLEYNGVERGTDLALTVPACSRSPERFEATNEGFAYVVDGTDSANRTSLKVINPQGDLRLTTLLTDVRFPYDGELAAC